MPDLEGGLVNFTFECLQLLFDACLDLVNMVMQTADFGTALQPQWITCFTQVTCWRAGLHSLPQTAAREAKPETGH